MDGVKNFSLVRRLVFIVLILLISLLFIQASITLWGRHVVSKEIYSSAQNNVIYLCETFEENIAQIRSSISEQLFVRNGTSLINFYTKMRKNNFKSEMEYQWELKKIFEEVAIVINANLLVDELDIYFGRLGKKLESRQGNGVSNIRDVSETEIDKFAQAIKKQKLVDVDGRFYIGVFYPDSVYRTSVAHMMVTVHLDEKSIRNLLSAFNTYSGKNALLYHHSSKRYVMSKGDITLSEEDLAVLFSEQPEEGINQKTVQLAQGKYIVMYSYSADLNCSFVQLIPAIRLNKVPDMLLSGMLMFCLVTLFVLSLLLHTLQRYVNRPVLELTSAFQMAGKGELNTRVNEQRSQEFNILANGFNHMASQLDELIDSSYRQKIMLQHAELKTLQAQINPHFLYNSFFFLRSMMENEENEVAAEFAGYLGQYFRYLTSKDRDILPLETEYDHAITYLKIQLMRFGETVSAEIDTLSDAVKRKRVPRLIIQPVLENCIEHGMNSKADKVLIRITCVEKATQLHIIVENSGDGLEQETLKMLRTKLASVEDDTNTSGLINVHRRLRLHYGSDSGVELYESDLGGLKVCLKIGGMNHDVSDSVG